MRPLAKGILLILVAGACIEVGARFSGRAGPFFTEPAFEQLPGASYWSYKPNRSFQTYGPTRLETGPRGQRLGFRASQPASSRAAPGPLVLAVGDSFTLGQAVAGAEAWPARLEAGLQISLPGVRVANFGVQGHSLRMITAHATDLIQELDPDLVVVAFIADDLDAGRENKSVDRFGYLARGRDLAGPAAGMEVRLRAIARQSHALLLFKHWWEQAETSVSNPARPGEPPATMPPPQEPVWVAELRALQSRLGDVPLLLAHLDLQETEAAAQMSRTIRERLPELELIYFPPYFTRMPPEKRRVPIDGHPSAAAHAVYARELGPAAIGHLSGPGAANLAPAAAAPDLVTP